MRIYKSRKSSSETGAVRRRWTGNLPMLVLAAAAALVLSCVIHVKADPGADAPNEMIIWRTVRQTTSMPVTGRSLGMQRIGISVKMNLVKVQDSVVGKAWIFNLDTKRFWLISYNNRTFSEDTFDILAEHYSILRKNERVKLEQEKQTLNSMEEDARDRMAKEIEERLAFLDIASAKLKIKSAGENSPPVAGYPVKPVQVRMGGDTIETVWITEEVKMPEGWRRFLDVMSEIDPLEWKVEGSLDNIALKGESDFGGRKRSWETQNLLMGSVAVSDFNIPQDFAPEPFEVGKE